MFGLGNSFNKFVEVFIDLILNLVVDGVVGRKRLKFGGICFESFIGVGVLLFKGFVNFLEGMFFIDLGV